LKDGKRHHAATMSEDGTMALRPFEVWLGTIMLALMCMTGSVQAQQNTSPKPVIVATVKATEFSDRVEALGTTRANETVRITTNVTEKIAEIRFDDGQVVAKGDVLAVLAKREEEADLRAARAILAEKRLAFDRAKQLESQRFAARAQLDLRQAEVLEFEARIAAINARIEDRVIRAPFAGVVGLRNISVGTLVEPGDVITTLDDVSTIKIDFTVPSTYLSILQRGLQIVARARAFGERRFEGTVSGVDTRVDPVTRSVIARAILPNSDGILKPGLLMTIELLKEPRTALFVPEEALIPRGRENHVLIVDQAAGNTLVRRKVVIGARRPGIVEIRDGLEEGEQVVTRGILQVRPGQEVDVLAVDDGDTPLSRVLNSAGDGAL
jgi:membrane fusion protein (multidrug efflux system)